jgi:hypothetical protein
MKLLISIFLASMAYQARAVELRDATNQQLLEELSYRLRTGGPVQESAIASYTCDNFDRLNISVISSTGQEATAMWGMANTEVCANTASLLNSNKGEITRNTLIAGCNNFNRLQRYTVTTTGRLSKLPDVATRTAEECIAQSNDINTRN